MANKFDFLFMVSRFCLLKQEPVSLGDLQPPGPHQLSLPIAFFACWARGKADGPRSCTVTLRPPRTFCAVGLATLCVSVSQTLAFEVRMNTWKAGTVMSLEG